MSSPTALPTDSNANPIESWKRSLQQAVRSSAELPGASLPGPRSGFPVLVPPAYLQQIDRENPADPLLRQVQPAAAEAMPKPDDRLDPVGDQASSAGSGILHKYHGRVLLVATGACAIHCRYCFRQHFPYSEQLASRKGWRDALNYIEQDSSIREVILSGGDPLMLETRRLRQLTDALESIAHVRRLRIHTRIPTVLPERIDDELMDWLAGLSQQVVVVIHSNHARELGPSALSALARLGSLGVTLLNQSVLLAGVNDQVDALCELSEGLMDAGVLPYYLHLLDRVAGAAHFEVSEDRALDLVHSVRARLPGYLVPRLVREVAGEPYKLPVL